MKRQRTLEAFKRIVIGASLKQPLVVIFEDLHWIDDETQEALNLLVDGIASARVLLLVNYRPEYRHSWGNRSHYNQLRLDPLEPQDAQVMLDALLGENAELKALKQLIIEETAGNPFFMEELVQAEPRVHLGQQIAPSPNTHQIEQIGHLIVKTGVDSGNLHLNFITS